LPFHHKPLTVLTLCIAATSLSHKSPRGVTLSLSGTGLSHKTPLSE